MPLFDPFTFVVRVHHRGPLGEAMNQIRSWLDAHKIQTTSFKSAADGDGYTFTIGFRSTENADRFRLQFAG